MLAIFGEHSPFLATAYYLGEHLAHCVNQLVPGAKHRAPEENGPRFVELVNEYLTTQESSGSGGENDAMSTQTDRADHRRRPRNRPCDGHGPGPDAERRSG